MKNLLICINGELTGQVVVNTESEKTARETFEHFNGEQGEKLTFQDANPDMKVPSMFSSCIMDAKDFL